MTKTKTEIFIEKATKKHNGYYSYENAIYIKSVDKIEITCPVHGSFWQRPNAHLNGSGCVKCRYKEKPDAFDQRDNLFLPLSTRDEILNYIKIWDIAENTKTLASSKHEELMTILYKETSFLDQMFNEIRPSTRLYCFMKGFTEVPTCKDASCDEKVNLSRNPEVFTQYCSYDCSRSADETRRNLSAAQKNPETIKAKKKATEKYYQNLARERGYDNHETYTHSSHFPDIIEKRKDTMTENWVGGHPMRDPTKREEIGDTFEEKYGKGIRNPIHIPGNLERVCKTEEGEWRITLPETREKSRQTMTRKWGGHYMSNPGIKEQRRLENQKKYSRDSYSQLHISEESIKILASKELLEEKVKDRFFSDVAEELGVHASSVQRACASHGISIKRTSSKAEKEIAAFVESLGFDVLLNTRPITSSYEIDIFIPEKNLGIEYNGMYWHCEENKQDNYHQVKSLAHQEEGIDVIHVWEDDWTNGKKEIILNKLKAKLGKIDRRVGARQTIPSKIRRNEAKDFFEANHIQGHVDGTVYIGLKDKNRKLVACMTMKNMKNGIWDLSRFATSCSVMGGLSKCLSYFKKEFEWSQIYTFASLDYSRGKLYESCGFDFDKITAPNMWYMKRGQWIRLGRRRFTKNKLEHILENFDPILPEKENMRRNGFTIIYDAGSIKYTMSNT